MSDNLLEIEGLRVHFDTLDGPIEALHSVDLKVNQGQIMGLVGESGCGKSVTSLVTIGLATCDVDEGSVKYEGEELLFRDSESDKRIQDISGTITVVSLLASILFFFWVFLIDPIQGGQLFLISISLTIASWLVGFAAKHEYRRHQKFMRWVRGNEISMIFQEPMTALNPLYTVEKQISEVMRVHDRLVEAETPSYVRVGQALVSPATLIRDAFSSRPQASIAILSVFAFVLAAHMSDYADAAASAVAAPFALIWSFFAYISLGLIGVYGGRQWQRRSFSGPTTLDPIFDALFVRVPPQIPLVFAAALVLFLMLWMPLSALLGMAVISTLLALPAIIFLDYLKLDPAHTRQVIDILEDVRIPNPSAVVKMYPHELSGGMRQRVMIAMMMACEPKLLIADEPTTALDVTIQAQILKLMQDLRDEKGTAILLITHDLGVIAEMCDAVTVMYAGSVVETGTIEDVLSRPRMPYSIGLLHSIPTIDEGADRRDVLPIIPGQVPDPNLHFDGCRFHPRCPFANEKCISTPPPMKEIEPGHFAACHHTDSIGENVAEVQAAFDVFAAEYGLEGVA
ncbi:MAG: ABC transporter ATP-binding protein [Candidatus Thalassarchaeum sp.]|nr:ABC transporter ATP-binding protein [Candidatus Thalassarchaeum sp.]HJM23260.1 ABC transporter ATP-binding protein [Candidatus Thalassarchaeum sp.]